jgi:phage terminase small subunit
MEKDINYLTQIFKILKNKMNNGIIIFSIDKFENKENYDIIRKLKEVLNKPIENYLLLLNKMDTSPNIEADVSKLNEKFAEYFPGGEFNATRNTIVPCCSFQLDNELKMEKDFPHLLYYNYINYIMEPKNYSSFMDYFKNYIQVCIKNKDAKVENIEVFKKNIESIKNDKNIEKIGEIIKVILKNHDTTKLKLILTEDHFKRDNIDTCLKDMIENDKEENGDDEDNDNKDNTTVNLADQTNETLIIL